MIRIDVFNEGVRLPYNGITKKTIKDLASSAVELLSLRGARITVIITDDAYITTINKYYRGYDAPTDVLSFSYQDNPFPLEDEAPEDMGDIFISIERAARQAAEYRVALVQEIKRLIVHGILHLAGYDHERSKKEERIMARKEKEIYDNI